MQRSMVLILLVASCSSPVAEPSTTSSSTSPPSTTTSTTMPATTTTTIVPAYFDEDVPTLALYLAAIEQGIEGTELEGAAYEEPESLINTGVLFCGLLDEGFSPVDVLRPWVAALSAGGETPTEDDLLLGGVILGAAVKFICPEYLEL